MGMDKAEASTTGQLLQQKGLEHEAAYLHQLKPEYLTSILPSFVSLLDNSRLY